MKEVHLPHVSMLVKEPLQSYKGAKLPLIAQIVAAVIAEQCSHLQFIRFDRAHGQFLTLKLIRSKTGHLKRLSWVDLLAPDRVAASGDKVKFVHDLVDVKSIRRFLKSTEGMGVLSAMGISRDEAKKAVKALPEPSPAPASSVGQSAEKKRAGKGN